MRTSDLDIKLQSKANTVDVCRALRNADILHSQLAHLTILLSEFITLLGLGPETEERLESEKKWNTKRSWLNTQCARVVKWIISFDPKEASMDATPYGADDHLMA